MFMNDLAYVVNQSKLSAYADDTQIFHTDQDPVKVQETKLGQRRQMVRRKWNESEITQNIKPF